MKLLNKWVVTLSILTCLFVPNFVSAQTLAEMRKDNITYLFTSDKTITISWKAGTNAASYDIRLYRADNKAETSLGNTTALEKSFKVPKTGLYVVKIRSVNASGTSAWVESVDVSYATDNGVPRSWWLYGYPGSSGPIIIGQSDLNNINGGI